MRESCITHKAKQAIAIVREDYYLLMNGDTVAAAILNIFEYWANAEIAKDPTIEEPWIGQRRIKDFEILLLGISTDKQIRARIKLLEERGFIETKQDSTYRRTLTFRFCTKRIQAALDEIEVNGQTTAESTVKQPQSQRSNNRRVNGQTTAESTVKQPFHLYKKDLLKEDLKEIPPTPQGEEGERDGKGEIQKTEPVEQNTSLRSEPNNEPPARSELACETEISAAPNFESAVQRFERIASGQTYPWTGSDRKPIPEFIAFVAKLLPRREMHPLTMARNHILNCQRTGELDKIEGYWADFQVERAKAEYQRSLIPQPAPEENTPPAYSLSEADKQNRLNKLAAVKRQAMAIAAKHELYAV